MQGDATILLARVFVAYVFLYAAYLNAKPENRDWLVTHTALLFRPGTSVSTVRIAALIGVSAMVFGGILILVGVAMSLGAAVLIIFTIVGYLQHRKEVELATNLANALTADLAPLISNAKNQNELRDHLTGLRVAAYSGQFSSGLKNWGLVGALLLLGFVIGSGQFSLNAYIKNFHRNALIDLVVWPM